MLPAVRRGERPLEIALYEAHAGLAEQWPQQPGGEVRGEVRRVGVEVDDHFAARDRERPPHRVPLPERGAELGQQPRLLVDLRAACRGDLRASVVRGCVDHEDLVDQRRERL
jgi:hypothetical protein